MNSFDHGITAVKRMRQGMNIGAFPRSQLAIRPDVLLLSIHDGSF